MHVINTVFMEM